MNRTMIEMRIGAIGLDRISGEPVILLSDAENKCTLPIWVGPIEARAIGMAVNKVSSPRPLTHDLLHSMIKRMGYKLKEVQINELDGQVYKADLVLSKENGIGHETTMSIDARPSDAIALAAGAGAPVLVGEDIVIHARLMLENRSVGNAEKTVEKDAEFSEFLENLNASDFNALYPEGFSVDDAEREQEEDSDETR